jgi:hypothetical protein
VSATPIERAVLLLTVEKEALDGMPHRAAAEDLERSILRAVQHLVRQVADRRKALEDTTPKEVNHG